MSRADREWWRGCTIYQVYPRSFADRDGDGVGDLPGLVERLDYIAELGVDALWLSPVMQSPMRDFGYDVSSYREIDPLFGTAADFDRLIAEARRRGLAVIFDLPISHTSELHAWFVDSRRSRDADKADWYVWADPEVDGSPPNNWLSVFGGSAWQWDARREQYYLHNFLPSQPDLNFHNPAVVDQVVAELAYWLDRGVGGFRLDAINFYLHDPALRDNPPRLARDSRDVAPRSNPYTYQRHVHDKSQPGIIAVLRRLRALADRYPGTVLLGELSDDEPERLVGAYTAGTDRLHMAYSLELASAPRDPAWIVAAIERVEAHLGDGWPCWSLGNHDVPRLVTRWGGATGDPALARLGLAVLVALRGSLCVYQGDELGLGEATIPRERIRDPYGLELWPVFQGRDGCRTPMPWDDTLPHAGFSTVEPWLPIPAEHLASSVARQVAAGDSILHSARRLLRWRGGNPVLRRGAQRFVPVRPPGLAIVRSLDGEHVVGVFNFGPDPLELDLAALVPEIELRAVTGLGLPPARRAGHQVTLAGFGALFAESAS